MSTNASTNEDIEHYVASLQEDANANRRNLDQIGTQGVTGVTDEYGLSDLWVLAPAGIISYVTIRVIPPGRAWGLFALGVMAVSLAVSAGLIYLSPPGLSPYQWVRYTITLWRTTPVRSAANGDSGRLHQDRFTSQGERNGLEDLTRVDAFAPGVDGIWRFDGTLVGGVAIDPAELSLADDQQWEGAASELGEVVNAFDHAGELRSSAVQIDTDDVRRRCTDRLADEDVQQSRALKRNIDMYRTKLPQQLRANTASIRAFQFIVTVSMHEVQMQDRRILTKLGHVPFIGGVIESLAAGRGMTVREIRRKQARELADRRSTIQEEMSSVPGCDADELSLNNLAAVFKESWIGERTTHGTAADENAAAETVVDDRSIPVVTMERQYTASDTDTRSPETLGDDELNQALADELLKNSGIGDGGSDTDSNSSPGLDVEQEQTPEQPTDPAQAQNQPQEVYSDDD